MLTQTHIFLSQRRPSAPDVVEHSDETGPQLVSTGDKMGSLQNWKDKDRNHRSWTLISFYFMASNTNSSLWERNWQHESFACWASLNDGKEHVSLKWQHFSSFLPCYSTPLWSSILNCPLLSFHTVSALTNLSSFLSTKIKTLNVHLHYSTWCLSNLFVYILISLI